MDEIWKDISGYEGKYQISNLGRVKSLKHRNKDKILKPLVKEKGYIRVHLTSNGKNEWIYVHRLVAEAFIDKKMGDVVTIWITIHQIIMQTTLSGQRKKKIYNMPLDRVACINKKIIKSVKMAHNGTKRHKMSLFMW